MKSEKKPRKKFIADLSTDKTEVYKSVLNKIINPDLRDDHVDLSGDPKNDQSALEQVDQEQDRPSTKPLSDLATEKLSYGSLDTKELSHSVAKSIPSQDSETLSYSEAKPLSNQVKGYFLPNWIQDELIPTLELAEQSIFLRIVRLTLGFNRQISDSVGLSKLAEKCNLSQSGLKKALKSLENRALIKVHSDLSRNSKGGNRYEVLFNSSATQKLSHSVAKSPSGYIKDHDHDFKITDHHQSEVMMIYKNLTGNNSWTKSDSAAYEKIKHLSLQEISQLIKTTLEKAHQKPASLAYFVKAYLNPTVVNPAQKSAIKAKLAAIVERKRQAHVGARYGIADLAYDVKAECIREGIAFDNDLFNEIIEKKN